jgi:hypothetical protein
MISDKIKPPTLYELSDVFHDKVIKKSYGGHYTPEKWHNFLEECGISHVSMSRVKVVDNQKYFLAKIKYGF